MSRGKGFDHRSRANNAHTKMKFTLIGNFHESSYFLHRVYRIFNDTEGDTDLRRPAHTQDGDEEQHRSEQKGLSMIL